MRELERTYLLKYIPEGLKESPSKEIIDIYIPASDPHPKTRMRKHGEHFEITKKEPVHEGDSSHQEEQTIHLNEREFNAFSAVDGKQSHKIRYYFDYKGTPTEVGIFQGPLAGLVLVDVEFETFEAMQAFNMPEFCLAEVTQEKFTAGGMLCGKSYEDIEGDLNRFNYKKIFLE